MPAIKITLQRLVDLFSLSVNDVELPEPIRKLAARLMTLTAHSIRIEAKIDKHAKNTNEQIVELIGIVQELAKRVGLEPAAEQVQPAPKAPPPTQTPPATNAAPAPVAAEEEQANEGEESEEAFEQRMLAEAQNEVAAINAGDVTPLRKPAGAA